MRSLCRATAAAQDPFVALAQLALEAELRELEEAHAARVDGHVVLIGQRVRAVVRVVIAGAVPELPLLSRLPGVTKAHRDIGRAMLADPAARPVERLVGGDR